MTLSQSEVVQTIESLARMGLIARDERPALTRLTGGVSSLIVRADTERGTVCLKRALPKLRVAAEWRAPVERNSSEVGWMKIAALVVPGSVPAILGEDRVARAFAMAYLDPKSHPVWKTQLRDGIAEVSAAQSVATNLVAIHNATARNDDMARAFANDTTFHSIRLEPYFAAAAHRHADSAHALHRLIDVTAHTKLALVHGDVSPKNILIGPQQPIFLDAECAWYGDPAFDLAFCLTHLLLKCVWRPHTTRAFLQCFDALAATYLAAVHWEPSTRLESRAVALLAGMLLARIDGKSPVEYITEEGERERVRRFAKHALALPLRLVELRNAWAEDCQR